MLLESDLPLRVSRDACPGTIQESGTPPWNQDRAEQKGQQVMGTNYDWRTKVCQTCGHAAEEKHIGKSSAGWCFALHVYPEEGILTLENWITKWTADPQGVIRNEYEEVLSVEEMIEVITRRMRDAGEQDILVYGYVLRLFESERITNHLG